MPFDLPPMSAPYICAQVLMQLAETIDVPALLEEAYLTLYDPSKAPQKFKSMAVSKSGDPITVLLMPYLDPEGFYLEKTLFIDPKTRPGITGYISVYDRTSGKPIGLLDATALTGLRTAAKSALFAKKAYNGETPRSIVVVGSSTQAFHHAIQMSRIFPKSPLYIVARSTESDGRIRAMLDKVHLHPKIISDLAAVEEGLDLVATMTSGGTPIISESNQGTARVLIAVGSSTGEQTEIDLAVVSKAIKIVDARVSIPGKGELAIPLQQGVIQDGDIGEFRDFLRRPRTVGNPSQPVLLFVSKGLAIEDYVLTKKILEGVGK